MSPLPLLSCAKCLCSLIEWPVDIEIRTHSGHTPCNTLPLILPTPHQSQRSPQRLSKRLVSTLSMPPRQPRSTPCSPRTPPRVLHERALLQRTAVEPSICDGGAHRRRAAARRDRRVDCRED